MKGKKTPPPWYEWDFGQVPEGERDWCALWEYAREAKWVAREVKKWFSTRFVFPIPFAIARPYKLDVKPGSSNGPCGPPGASGKTVLEVLQDAGRKCQDGVSCLDALPDALKWGTTKPPETLPDRCPSFLRRFCLLVVELPRFPTPWLKIEAGERKKAVERLGSTGCSAFTDTLPAFQIEEFDEGFERIRSARAIMRGMWPESPVREGYRHYVLTVDWDECTYDKALERFREWLNTNPHRKSHRRGRKNEKPIPREILRNLAALRWKRAGFEFTEAKAAILTLGLSNCELLHLHNRKSGNVAPATHDVWWHCSEAAEKTLQTLYPPPRS